MAGRSGFACAVRLLVFCVALCCFRVAIAQGTGVPGESFLSDRAWTSAGTSDGPPARDRAHGAAASDPAASLTINGTRYAKGLGVFGNSRIVYLLNRQCSELRVVVGLDDSHRGTPVGSAGSVSFRIWLDGILSFESGLMRGSSPALPVHLDVSHVRELVLETLDGGDGTTLDAADWAGARMICDEAAVAVPLVNPGFEGGYVTLEGAGRVSGQVAPGWEDNSGWADVDVRYSEDTAAPRSGSASQKISIGAVRSGEMQFLQTVALVAGRRYTPSVWLKGTDGLRVNVSLQRGSAPWTRYVERQVELSGTWRQVSLPGFVGESASASLMISAARPGVIHVDDAALRYVTGSPAALPPIGTTAGTRFGMHLNGLADTQVRNPGFEAPYRAIASGRAAITGEIAHWWQDNSEWADVEVRYSQDGTSPRSGLASQKVDVRAVRSGAVQLVRSQTLASGATYTLSAWLRGTPGLVVTLALREGGAPYTDYAARDVVLTGEWQSVSVSGRVTGSRAALIMVRASSPGVFWLDDVALSGGSEAWRWPTVPVGTLRLWDAGTTWSALEPVKGQFDFGLLDQYVREAEQRRVQVTLTLGQSPTWASARPGDVSYNGAGAPAEPANIQDWRDYVTAVVRRYRGRIHHYEVWNEPNDPTFYSGSVSRMVELTREAFGIIRANDPAARVLSPAPYSVGWMDEFLALGGGRFVDVIAYHHYATPPEGLFATFANLRQVLRARGAGMKPVWHTEAAAGNAATPLSTGATFLARMYFTSFAAGASRFNWYAWGPGSAFFAATTTPDGLDLVPAGRAFGVIQEWLAGTRILSVTRQPSGLWTMHLRMTDGTRGWIVWSEIGMRVLLVPTDWGARSRTDLFGASASMTGVTALFVSGSPQLIRSTLP